MKACKGFSLIELMIAVAVVGILASVAYPSYLDHIRKGRRADAQAVMMDVASREGQFLIDSRSYGGCCGAASDLGLVVANTVDAHYTIAAVTDNTVQPPTFQVTATPKTADQAKDKCGTMSINQQGVKTAADSGCW